MSVFRLLRLSEIQLSNGPPHIDGATSDLKPESDYLSNYIFFNIYNINKIMLAVVAIREKKF